MYRVLTVADDVDIREGHGLLVARIKAAVAAEEVRKIRQRVKDKHTELAGAGRPSGRAGYGYRNARGKDGRPTLLIEPAEARVLKEAARRLLRGQSMTRIAENFNDRGVRSARGGRWNSTILRAVLTKPSIAGLRVHNGGSPIPAVWKPILDRATWEAVCRLLGQETTTVIGSDGQPHIVNRRHYPSRRWLLTAGIARCGECGAKMVGQPERKRPERPGQVKRAQYVCSPPSRGGCSRVSIRADELEQYVERVVLSAFSDKNVARLIEGRKADPRSALVAKIDKDREELDAITDLYNAGKLTLREQQRMRVPVAARLAKAEAQLRALPGSVDIATTAKKLREEWPTYSILQKQQAIGLLFEKIEIRKAAPGTRKFDRDRVIFWEVADGSEMPELMAQIVEAVRS
jgi:site-specific DNA recombinase